MTPREQEAFNAKRATRSRVIGIILAALAVLFFLITIVRMGHLR